MAVSYHAMSSGYYSTQSITASTNVRDVSEMLDLWAHEDTPFLNRLSWGADSGGLLVEWLTEHLGWGYYESTAAVGSGSAAIDAMFDPVTSANLSATGKHLLQEGCLLYAYTPGNAEHAMIVVNCIGGSDSVLFDWLLTSSVAACTKWYVIGNFANEGSDPRTDNSRTRDILSNKFAILRKDINITGSQAATDMYAVPNELRHQMRLRLIEMQREREMSVLYSSAQARSTTAGSLFNGIFGFMRGETGSHHDSTTTSFTETAFNNMVASCWENRGNPKVFVASPTITRKFTAWDRSRVRTEPDNYVGGYYVARYLTDIGIEVELLPLRKVPLNLAFLLDTSKINLRAKKGRKAIVEKLGKTGDYEQWQMLSEFSLEFRGYNLGQHGMFSALTG